jgi:hypothetical protein
LPDTADSAAEVLIEGYNAWVANVLDDPENSQSFTPVPTTWTLVERAADSGGGIPGATDALAAGIRMRSLAGGSPARVKATGSPLSARTAGAALYMVS